MNTTILRRIAVVVLMGSASVQAATCGAPHGTTAGTIAIANLDAQLQRLPQDATRVDPLLERARFLADAGALAQAVALAERAPPTPDNLLRRARAHAAAHRFAQADTDLRQAMGAGADPDLVRRLRQSLRVATGDARSVLPTLEAQALAQPGYAAHAAVAVADAELGRHAAADAAYAHATAAVDTTSPFPYAWLAFARGVLWSEQVGDAARGERFYAQALACLPDFAQANLHMAELEVARGAYAPAQARLQRILARGAEPEALALLGRIQLLRGQPVRAVRTIVAARDRFERLLAREPLAYADHAAEFYLGVGNDPARAWQLALMNLANRQTSRAITLANRAAQANGWRCDTCANPRPRP